MNYRVVSYILLQLMQIQGFVMLLPALVSLYYDDGNIKYFLIVSIITLIVSTLLKMANKPKRFNIYAKEGFVIVGLSWIIWSIIGAFPYYLSGAIPNFIDAYFESVSGFTTSGTSILLDVSVLPKSMMFWRSFTHWLGGMGVLVFVMAIMPLVDNRSMYIMKAEVPGPTVGKLVPRTKDTAIILYSIYLGLTMLEIVFLLPEMNLFNAINYAFSSAGTGGFSIDKTSVAYYDSAYVEAVIGIFVVLFGISFNIFYFIAIKKFRLIFKNDELKAYLLILLFSTIIIMFNIMPIYGNLIESFRYSSFQVAAMITTTGFTTANFNNWPMLSKIILMVLMTIGACSGSTGGGIKIARLVIIVKSIYKEIRNSIHPNRVVVVNMNGKKIENETIRQTCVFFVIFFFIAVVSTLIVSLDNYDLETTITSVLACLSNGGPGLGAVIGPESDLSSLSNLSKFVLTNNMLFGRLEIYPILLLLSPSTWRKRF